MAPSKWTCSKDVSVFQSKYYFSTYCLMFFSAIYFEKVSFFYPSRPDEQVLKVHLLQCTKCASHEDTYCNDMLCL